MRSDRARRERTRCFRIRANGRGAFTRRDAPGVQRAKRRTPAALSAYAQSARVHADCGNRQQQQPVLLARRPMARFLDRLSRYRSDRRTEEDAPRRQSAGRLWPRSPPLRGATWGPNDIVFATVGGERRLWRVPASGGVPETLTRLDPKDSRGHSLPQMLPDGRAVVYTIWQPGVELRRWPDRRHVARDGRNACRARSRCRCPVRAERSPRVRSRRHADGGAIRSANRLRVTGTPVVNCQWRHAGRAHWFHQPQRHWCGAVQCLEYRRPRLCAGCPCPGTPDVARVGESQWHGDAFDPATGPYGGPRLSPDGQRVAAGYRESRDTDPRSRSRRADASGARELWPTFTPDGKQITVNEPSGFVSTSIEGGATDHCRSRCAW